MAPNRAGEPYPIHGDGWLQAWELARPAPAVAELRLASRQHGGSPYAYDALQRFELVDGGLDAKRERARTAARRPLPYGLGLHPWFPRTPRATVHGARRRRVAERRDPIPTRHTTGVPSQLGPEPRRARCSGALIDNGYDRLGRHGHDRAGRSAAWRVSLTMEPLRTPRGPVGPEHCLVYRAAGSGRCLLLRADHPARSTRSTCAGRPGTRRRWTQGETLMLRVHWRVDTRAPRSPPS